VAQLAPPFDIPIALTIEAGNINDQTHMWKTYGQVRHLLQEKSLVVFDRGANDKTNLDQICLDRNDYLTAKKLNASDDKIYQSFSKDSWECIDASAGIYALKRTFPSRVNYYFFSEKLKKEHLRSRRRKAERLFAEARSIQNSLDNKKKLPKRFCINNPLVDVKYDYQTKLVEMNEEEALRLLLDDVIDGREGCFCLTSSRDMPASEALKIYRSKDAIEKLFHSLKSEIDIKPVQLDRFFMYQDRLIKCGSASVDKRWIYRFEDTEMRVEEEKNLHQLVLDGQLTREELAEKLLKSGHVLILSSLNTEPEKIYNLYKRRDAVEKMFDSYKNVLNADRTFLRDDASIFGHVFIAFLYLYAYWRIENLIRKAGLLDRLCPADVLQEFSKVYKVDTGDRMMFSDIPKGVAELDRKLGTNIFPKIA
jgi:transposase